MDNFPTLFTDRLCLRQIATKDQTAIFDIFSRDVVTEHYNFESFTQPSQAAEWIASIQQQYLADGAKGWRWGITIKEQPESLIGSCGFHNLIPYFHSLELGYELHPEYWGQGIITEAITAIINHCLTTGFPIKTNRISATTDIENLQSISVLKRLGFSEEGILREYGFWKGNYHNVRLFSLLQNEWPSITKIL